MNDTPLVSVGIPTFNREALISRAIDSVLNQDYPNIEIVISDNCSTDGTAAVCRNYAQAHPRIRFVQQPRNLGATSNFLEVLRHASGNYFMWLGDDDWLDANYVSVALTRLQTDRSVSLAGGTPIYYRNGEKHSTGKIFSVLSGGQYERVLSYYWNVADNGIFYGLMRTADLRSVQPKNIMGGDWIFVANLAAMGKLVMSSQTSVHRELGGATASYRNIARVLGISTLHALFPFASIACSAFTDVAFSSKAYQDQSRWTRSSMAAATFLCICAKASLMHIKNWIRRLRHLYRGLA